MIYNSYCKLCVYPLTAVNINSYKGVCSACRVETSNKFFLEKSKKKFENVIIKKIKKNNRLNNNYDCLIPVSGGKISYYQTHLIVKRI